MDTVFQKKFQRDQFVHTAAGAGDDRQIFPFQNRLDDTDPFSGQQVSADIRLIEDQIFRRIIQNFRIVQPKILI